MANIVAAVTFELDRCDCGVPSMGEFALQFGPAAGLLSLCFALLVLPIALIWWGIDRRWSVRRPLSVPKMMLAGALVGSCVFFVLAHKWTLEERAENTAKANVQGDELAYGLEGSAPRLNIKRPREAFFCIDDKAPCKKITGGH